MGAVLAIIGMTPLPDTRIAAVIRTVLVLVLFAGMAAQRSHDRKLCEPCIAAMPLNPQAEIVKHHRALTVAHSLDWAAGRVSRRILSLILLLIIWGVAVGVAFMPKPYSSITSVVVLLLTGVVMAWSLQWHGRLQPWCPRCRGDDGGDDTFNPDPVPAPSREKELT
jgi:hypothetical protein